MADSEEAFVPHSDEELARLLEEQLSQLRAATAEVSPVKAENTLASAPPSSPTEPPRDPELDELFSALLEDEAHPSDGVVEAEATSAVVEAPHPGTDFKPAADMAGLTATQPLDVVPIPSMFIGPSSEVSSMPTESESEIHPAGAAEFDVPPSVIAQPDITSISSPEIDNNSVHKAETGEANPMTQFERRPSFDELVFGVSTED